MRVNDQFEYFRLSLINAFVGPLHMGPTSTQLFVCYDRENHTRPRPDDLCRPDLDFNHACWLVPPAPSWWWHVWSDPNPLETGAVLVLSGRDSFN